MQRHRKSSWRRVAGGVVVLASIVLGARAHADAGRLSSGGMDLRLFRPAIDSKGHLSVNGTDILGDGDFSFGLILDGGFGLLPFEGFENDEEVASAEARRVDRLIGQAFTGTFHFNYGLFNLLVLGIQVPVQVVNGENVTAPGFYNETMGSARPRGVDFQDIGDITLHGKVRLLRAERNPIGLAAILHVTLPTGTPESFGGDPGVAVWPVLAAEWRPVRRFRLSANLGYRLISGDGPQVPVDGRTEPGSGVTNATMPQWAPPAQTFVGYDDMLTFGVGASFRAADALDLVVETYGTQVLSSFGTRGALSAEALAGFKIFVDRNSYLMLAGGIGYPRSGFYNADYRATLGFIFEPSIGDRDGDGYKDDVDECPDDPEDFDTFQDEDGCPDPDNDRDGILDVDDECPMVPEDKDGDADEDGCPEGNEGDRDGDGILDSDDQCPDDPEDKDGFEDEDGCPDPDNDQDGILDVDDLCPNDPEDQDGFEDEDGCPDPDNDRDRILDVDDQCPNDPETYNGTEDEDGCPDRGRVVIEEDQILILEKIHFETDSAVIKPESYSIVDAVAATLKGNPQIRLVEIQGHADERASDRYNLRLTQDRANAVLEALVERGVERSRLRAVGYGELCPVDPRHNAEAWEKNRRVEFKIVETDDGPTGVELACPAARRRGIGAQ